MKVCSWLLTVVLVVQCVLAGYFGGKLVIEKTFGDEKDYKPCKKNEESHSFENTDVMNCYDEVSLHQETGSIIFHQDIESSTTMKEQYSKL